MPGIVLNALFLTHWIFTTTVWGGPINLFYELSHGELSDLPKVHDCLVAVPGFKHRRELLSTLWPPHHHPLLLSWEGFPWDCHLSVLWGWNFLWEYVSKENLSHLSTTQTANTLFVCPASVLLTNSTFQAVKEASGKANTHCFKGKF